MKKFLLRYGWLYLLVLGFYFMPDVTPLAEKYWAGVCLGIFVTLMWYKT